MVPCHPLHVDSVVPIPDLWNRCFLLLNTEPEFSTISCDHTLAFLGFDSTTTPCSVLCSNAKEYRSLGKFDQL